MKTLIRIAPPLGLLLALTLGFSLLLLSGCAASKPDASVSTSALSGHLDKVSNNLSRVDGKSVVIESWLQSH
jgi:hypothetical protein